MSYNTIEIPVGSGKVVAYHYRGGGRGKILMCHGFPGVYKHEDLAEYWAESGFSVFLLKYRGVDESPGVFTFTSAIEDVGATIDFLNNEYASYGPLGVFGYSAGGYYSLSAACGRPSIAALAMLSPVADLPRAASVEFENIYELMLAAPDVINIRRVADLVASFATAWHDHNALECIQRLAGLPIFIAEGNDSEQCDSYHAHVLYDLATGPKTYCTLGNSGHYFDHGGDRKQLMAATAQFFKTHLDACDSYGPISAQIAHVPCTDRVDPARRGPIAKGIDAVADTIWNKVPTYWQNDVSLFSRDTGLSLAIAHGRIVGFLVYERVPVQMGLLLHVRGLNVLPEHHGAGLGIRLCVSAVASEIQKAPGIGLFVCARTRNPEIMSIFQRACRRVLPSHNEVSAEFLELACSAARKVLSGENVDLPDMVVRDAYSSFSYINEPRHREVEALATTWGLGPTDALFVFGELEKEKPLFSRWDVCG